MQIKKGQTVLLLNICSWPKSNYKIHVYVYDNIFIKDNDSDD